MVRVMMSSGKYLVTKKHRVEEKNKDMGDAHAGGYKKGRLTKYNTQD